MSELRDHSQPCEHAPNSTHPLYRMGHTQDGGWCVGGKLVRISVKRIRQLSEEWYRMGNTGDGLGRLGDDEITWLVSKLVEVEE